MPKLLERQPRRFFTFGCSFTRFSWPTWADIIGQEIGVPFHNYGKEGAGNLYIHNHLMQADAFMDLGPDDLVMICWSGVNREDRWIRGIGGWLTPGNVFHANTYGEAWVREFADPYGYAMRDYALIKSTVDFLRYKGCQFHMFSMDSLRPVTHWRMFGSSDDDARSLLDLYQDYLDLARPSMYDVLWGGDAGPRVIDNQKNIHPECGDGHPHVAEHLAYLESVFDHRFSDETRKMADRCNVIALDALREVYRLSNGDSTKTDWKLIEKRILERGLWLGLDHRVDPPSIK